MQMRKVESSCTFKTKLCLATISFKTISYKIKESVNKDLPDNKYKRKFSAERKWQFNIYPCYMDMSNCIHRKNERKPETLTYVTHVGNYKGLCVCACAVYISCISVFFFSFLKKNRKLLKTVIYL